MSHDPAAAFAAALGPEWRGLVAARLGVTRQAAQRWGRPKWPAEVLDALDAIMVERNAALPVAAQTTSALRRG